MCPHANMCQAQRKRTLRSAGILRLFWRDRGRWRYTQFPGFTGTKVRILTQLLQEATIIGTIMRRCLSGIHRACLEITFFRPFFWPPPASPASKIAAGGDEALL